MADAGQELLEHALQWSVRHKHRQRQKPERRLGGEMGVRGWLTALDAATGALAWRAYSTGPDAEVLIGPRFKPFYAQDRGTDLGVSTWPPDAWKIGGGTVWEWISYDPEQNLVFHGTANPGPWNPAWLSTMREQIRNSLQSVTTDAGCSSRTKTPAPRRSSTSLPAKLFRR